MIDDAKSKHISVNNLFEQNDKTAWMLCAPDMLNTEV